MAQIDGASVGTRLYEVSRLILSLPSSAPFHRFGSATRLADTLDQAFSALTPLHDYITAEGPLVSANHSTQSEFAQRLRTLDAYARGASDLYDALITDIRFSDPSSLGDAARLEVTGTLADVYSDVFSREADRQATLSFRWLSAGLAAVVVLVGLTFAFLAAPIGDEISDPETIQAITLKVFAAGTVSALAFLCFRMFRATQHKRQLTAIAIMPCERFARFRVLLRNQVSGMPYSSKLRRQSSRRGLPASWTGARHLSPQRP